MLEKPQQRSPKFFLALALALSFLAAGVLSACGGDDSTDQSAETTAATETQDITMMLAFPAESAAWLPLHIAVNQGYFEEEGVSIDTPAADGSGFVTQQIIAGNQDWGWAGAPSDVIAASTDPSIRAVACNQAQNIFTIQAVGGSGVEDVADLEGKRLGITQKGGGEEPLIASVIAENDLDVEVIPLGEAGPAVLRAIEKGDVDAFSGGITDIFTLKAGGADLTDITPDLFRAMPGDCFITNSEVLADEANRELAAKVLRAWVKGSLFAEANTEAATDIICQEIPEQCLDREDFTQPFVEQMTALLQPLNPDLPANSIDIEGWQTTADVLDAAGALQGDVDVETLVASPDVKAVEDLVYGNIDQLREEATADAEAYQSSGG